jgi:hypothetical protein
MKTCKHGHPWTKANTYVMTTGFKVCMECKRASNRKWGAKRRKLLQTLKEEPVRPFRRLRPHPGRRTPST